MSHFRISLVAMLLMSFIPGAYAQWPASTFSAVQLSDSMDAHTYPMVFPDGSGGAIVTYFADSANFSKNSVLGQRVDTDGFVQWSMAGVPMENSPDNIVYNKWTKEFGAVSDGSGGVILTFKKGLAPDENIYAQRITAAGTMAWPGDTAIVTVTETQQSPAVLADGQGGAFVAWQDNRTDMNGDIYMQRVDASGARMWPLTGVAVCTVMNGQSHPVLCSDGAGGVIVAWSDQRRGAYDVYAQRFDGGGTPVWPDSGVELYHDNEWMNTIPCILEYGGQGKVLAAFIPPASTERYLKAQRIDTSGVLDWSASGVQLSYSMGIENVNVLPDSSGGAIYVWDDQVNWPVQVYAQRLDAAGSPMWGGNMMLSDGSDACSGVDAVQDSSGTFVAVWTDSSDMNVSLIRTQRFDLSGNILWRNGGEYVAEGPGDRNNPSVAAVAPGKCIVAWQDSRAGWKDIYAQQLPVPEPEHNVYNVFKDKFFTTLAEALDSVACDTGDVIVLMKDTVYTGNFVIPAGVALMADTTLPNKPVLDGNGSGVVVTMNRNTEIHGVRIVNTDTCGILFNYLSMGTCEVTDCEIDSCGTEFGTPSVIVHESNNISFVGNTFRERNSTYQVFCVAVTGMSMNVRFYNNVFKGEYWGGALLNMTSTTSCAFYNNVFDGFTNGAGGAAIRFTGMGDLFVKNNIFTGNYINLDMAALPTMMELAGNCHWGNDSTVAGSLAVIASPRFADSAGGDFHLAAHSPCIDAGVVLDSVAGKFFGKDYDGSPIDIGLYGGPLADAKDIPAQLDDFYVRNGGGFDTLYWTPSSDPSFSRYYIYRDTSGASFFADLAMLIDSSTVQGSGFALYPDGGKQYYYKVNVRNTQNYVGGYRLATGHAPEVAGVYYNDNKTTVMWDDTLSVSFTAPLDTAAITGEPWAYFNVYGGLINTASFTFNNPYDTVLQIAMGSFDIRPESIAVKPGALSGANGVEVLDVEPFPVTYLPPYIREAWYYDNGTNMYGDDIITVIFNTPVADSAVDTSSSGSFNDFVFYGGMQTTTTTKLGAANDETLFVHLGAGDTPPFAIRPQVYGLWDTSGMHPSTDTLPVPVFDISPARPDSVWPAAYSAQAVDMWASIGVHFSRAMAPGTIDTSSFTVTGDLHGRYAGNVNYNPFTRIALMSLDAGMQYGDRITCRIGTAVTDSLGNPLKRAYEWTFRVQEWSSGSDSLGHDPYVQIPLNGDTVKAAVWADMDRNGYPDLVVAVDNRPNRIYFNHNGRLDDSASWVSQQANRSFDVAVADVNGDGWQDVVFANDGQGNVLYLNGPDSMGSAPAWVSGETENTYGVALADIDGNGIPDLLTADYGAPNKVYYDSSGVFRMYAGWASDQSDNTYDVAAGDLDGDGMNDIVYGNGLGGYNRAYLNGKGGPAATASWVAGNPGDTRCILLEDIDRDERPDLICADNGNNQVYLNDGTTFLTTASYTLTPGDASYAVDAFDKDYDNDLDLVFVNHLGQAVIYQNDGGVLNSSPVWSSNVNVYEGVLALGDYDRDGDKDMVCIDTVGGTGRHLALFYNGNTPPHMGGFAVSQDTAGRLMTGGGYVYVDFTATDQERDSLIINSSYYSVGDTSNWQWLETVGASGYVFTPAGTLRTVVWDSRYNGYIESDSVWIRMDLWDPSSGYTSGYFMAGPFVVDNKPPVFGDSLTVIGSTDSSVTLQWGMAPDVNFDRYEIWYDSTGAVYRDITDSLWGPAKDPALNNASTVTTTVTGLRSGTSYGFRIWAYDSLGNDSAAASSPLFVYTDARVDGYVMDSLRAPVPGAQVVMVYSNFSMRDTVTTNAGGYYLFPKVKAQEQITVSVERPGFEPQWYKGVPDSMSAWQVYCMGDTTLDTMFMVSTNLFATDPIAALIQVRSSSQAWGDYDADGDLDVLVTGFQNGSGRYSGIYGNNAPGFSDISAGFSGLSGGSVDWADFNNDGKLDVVICGEQLPGGTADARTYVYQNDGGSFSTVGAGVVHVKDGKAAWGDYDNDGLADLVVMGTDTTGVAATRLYHNDGSGVFSEVASGLPATRLGDVAWGDYDNDGKLDILLSGLAGGNITGIYRNEDSTFVDAGVGMDGVRMGAVAFGDYDADGDLDVLVNGQRADAADLICKVYQNNAGSYSDIGGTMTGLQQSSAAWGDWDNDGDLDFVQTGTDTSGAYLTQLYENQAGTFVLMNAGLVNVTDGDAVWGDYDNDSDLDLLVTGDWGALDDTTVLYVNDIAGANTPPDVPTGLFAMPSPGVSVFGWSPASDVETPSGGLSYNVMVGTSVDTMDVVHPMSDPSGWRRVAAPGNAGCDTSFILKNLPGGKYYWSVQTVDAGFMGSGFAPIDSFVVAGDTVGPQLIKVDYYSNGTPEALDDTLMLFFDERLVFDSLDMSPGMAGVDFEIAGYGNLAAATAGIRNDSTVYIAMASGDSVLAHNRSSVIVFTGSLYDSAGNPGGGDTAAVTTWNVMNTRTMGIFDNIDLAQTGASPGDTILVLDGGIYTEALHVTTDLTFAHAPGVRPAIRYNGDKYNLFLIYADNGTGVSADFIGFDICGISIDGTDTLTKIIRADGGTYRNCSVYGAKSTMSTYLMETVNAGAVYRPLVIDSCEFYDNTNGAILWTKKAPGSCITRCDIHDVTGSSAGILFSGADTSLVAGNRIFNTGFAGIYADITSSENDIYGNLIYGNTYGINLQANGRNNRFMFNTIYGNSNTGYYSRTDAAEPDTFMYNIVWGNSTQDVHNATNTAFSDFNCFGTPGTWAAGGNSIIQDPLFVNAGTGDFNLLPGSPVVGRSDVDSARAYALQLAGKDLDGQLRPMPSGSFWDLGAFEEQTVLLDMTPPDNDMLLSVTAIDTDKVEIVWTPGDIDSMDADSVAVWYRYTAGVDGNADPQAVLYAVLPVTESVDTITGLLTDSLLFISVIPRDTAGNYADTAASSSGSIFMFRPADWVKANLTPDTAIAGEKMQFTCTVMPVNGTMDEVVIMTPFVGTLKIDSLAIAGMPVSFAAGAGKPVDPDSAYISLMSAETLFVHLAENRIGMGDTLSIFFSDSMTASPVTDSFAFYGGHVFLGSQYGLDKEVPDAWTVTTLPGMVDHYLMSIDTLWQTAGVPFNLKVTAKDRFDNTVTNIDTSYMTFSFSGPQSAPDATPFLYPSDAAIRESLATAGSDSVGKAVIPVTAYKAETCSLRFTDMYNGFWLQIDSLYVSAGPVDSLFVTPAGTTVTADDSVLYAARAEDAWQNAWDVTADGSTNWYGQGSAVSVVSGLYFADTSGTHDVWADYLGGVADTVQVTVNHGILAAINITTDTAYVTADTVLVLAVNGNDADSNFWSVSDTSTGTIWASDDAGIVLNGAYDPVTAGWHKVWADNGPFTDTCFVFVDHGALVSLDVLPDSQSITADDTLSLMANAMDADSNIWSVGDTATGTAWATDDTTGGTVVNGKYSPVAVGSYRVFAVNGAGTDTCMVTVTPGAVVSIDIDIDSASVTADTGLVLVATAADADGNTWDVSDSGATNWNTDDISSSQTQGLYEPAAAGSWKVWAENSGFTDTCFVVVTHGMLTSLDIDVDSAVVTSDSILQLTATAVDADANTWDVTYMSTWGTDDTLGFVIDGSYDGVSVGSYKVWTVSGSGSDTTFVTVSHGALVSLDIDIDSAMVTSDSLLQLTATGADADANTWDVTYMSTWGTDDTLGSVIDGSYDGVSVGSYKVWTVSGTGNDTTFVTVSHGALVNLDIDVDSAVVTSDSILQLTATAVDADANTWDVTYMSTWGTDDTLGSVIDGSYDGVSVGSYKVWTVSGSGFDTAFVTVDHGTLVSLDIDIDSAAVTSDSILQLTATGADADANTWDVTSMSAWGTDDVSVIVIDGGYDADSVGTYKVWADNGTGTDTAFVTVVPGAVAALKLAPAGTTLTADDIFTFRLTALDADGNSWNVLDSSAVVWTEEGTMTPVMAGVYYADTAGTHTVTAGYAGAADTASVTVTHGAAAGVDVAPDNANGVAGDTLQFMVEAYDADGNRWGIDSLATWTAGGTRFPADSGRYYADTAGTFPMAAGYLGFADTSSVTVGVGTPVSMELCHNNVTIPADSSFWFTAALSDGFGNAWSVTNDSATVWAMDDTVGTLVPSYYYYPVRTGVYSVWAVNSGISDTCIVTVTPGTIVGLLVTPDSAALSSDSSVQLTAQAYDLEGNFWDVTDSAVWGNDEPGNIMGNGLYAPDSVGTYPVYASYQAFSDTAVVLVTHGKASALVLGSDFTITADDTMRLNLTATDNDGNSWDATFAASWTTNDSAGGLVDSGMYVPVGIGTYHIAVAYDGLADTVLATVNSGVPVSLVVTPSTAAVTADSLLVLAAEVFDRNGNKDIVTGSAAWDTDDSTAVLSAGGYDPVATGMYRIWVGYSGLGDTCSVTVTAGLPAVLTISPDSAFIKDDSTMQFTAGVADADGNASSALPVWTIEPGSLGPIDTTGLFTPLETGTGKVRCTVNGSIVDSAMVTVEPSAPLAPLSIVIADDSLITLSADAGTTFSAVGKDVDGNDLVVSAVWSVSDTLLARIDPATGVFSPAKTGTVTVTATVDTLTDMAVVTIVPGTLAVFAIDQAADTVTTDETKQYTVTATDTKGNDVGLPVTWAVSDSSVGMVDAMGLFTPSAPGAVTVTAAVAGRSAGAALVVEAGAVASVVIGQDPGTVTTDTVIIFSATAYDNVMTELGSAAFTWSLAGDSVNSISDSGMFAPVHPGTLAVVVRAGMATDTVGVVVVPGRPAYLVISAPAESVAADSMLQYSATVYDADSNLTADSVVWSAGGTAGTINAAGLFDADSDGSGSVVAMAGSAADTVAVRVYDDIAPYAGLSLPALVRHSSAVVCTFSAADTIGHTGSAAAALEREYSLDGGAWVPVSGARTVIGNLVDGMHYVSFRAADAFGNMSVPVTDSVEIALAPFTVAAGGWRMISVPMDVSGKTAAGLAGTGGSDIKYLYRWDEAAESDMFTLKYVSALDEPLLPGAGYWIRTAADLDFAFDSLDTFAPARTPVVLYPGWNQAGNARSYPVNWFAGSVVHNGDTVSMDSAVSAGLLDNGLHAYFTDGDTVRYRLISPFDSAAVLPWDGFWVKAFDTCSVLLPVSAYLPSITQSPLQRMAARVQTADDWTVRMAVRSGTLCDEYNYIGVRRGAAAGRDRYDIHEPPVVGSYISLAALNGGTRLCSDIRSADGDIREWYLSVKTDRNGNAELSWDDGAMLPAGLNLYLYDLADGSVTDMRSTGTYPFTADAAVAGRLFRVVAAAGSGYEPAALPLKLAVTSVSPNPVVSSAVITYAVPAGTTPSVATEAVLYNAAGSVIRRLESGWKAAGTHTVTWDGYDTAGNAVLPGTYFIRINAGEWSCTHELNLIK